MNDDNRKSLSWHVQLAAVGVPVLVAGLVGWYVYSNAETPKDAPAKPVRVPPAYEYAQPTSLAVAQRRGRCRAMDEHLAGLAHAVSDKAAATELRALRLLAGEMMNGFPTDAVADPASRAKLDLSTPEGQRALLTARDGLLDALRLAGKQTRREAAHQISVSCAACHSRFVRGEPLRLSIE